MSKKQSPRELRKENGLYQYYVAKALGMDKVSYCLKENGKRKWTLSDVQKLSQFYNVSIEQLEV